ncbi:AraC family transcriptional regulator [Elizabethkingia sp. YR214]|uniref:AraC family transcriptional regulator n=1 Tax=Elizabethkingia sp. YR214 TaxID=2135667 RepID=UPI0011B1FD93|nr:AraC family transcriptional regulator [Elizabethkingia sp. YR214]
MNIIEQRLLYSEYSVQQLPDDLDFSDKRHLSGQFKKHKEITAAAFRKQFKN